MFLNTVEFLDPKTNEWTTSVAKYDISGDNETNGAIHNRNNGTEHNNNEINGKFNAINLSDSMGGDGYNFPIHSKKSIAK